MKLFKYLRIVFLVLFIVFMLFHTFYTDRLVCHTDGYSFKALDTYCGRCGVHISEVGGIHRGRKCVDCGYVSMDTAKCTRCGGELRANFEFYKYSKLMETLRKCAFVYWIYLGLAVMTNFAYMLTKGAEEDDLTLRDMS